MHHRLEDPSRPGEAGEAVIIPVDLDEEGRFASRRLVLTAETVTVYDDATGRALATQPVAAVTAARVGTDRLGAHLIVALGDGREDVLARSTRRLTPQLTYVATALEARARGEIPPPMAARDNPPTCPTCGRALPTGTRVCPACIDSGQVLRRLLAYVAPYRRQVALATVVLLFSTALQLVPPYITKILVDQVLVPRVGTALFALVALLFVASLLQSAAAAVRGYLGVWFGSRMIADIRRDTYNALMALSLRYFDQRQVSQFIGRVNSDSESMQQFLTDGIVMLTGQAALVVGVVAVMLSMDWQLTVVSVLTVPLLVIVSTVVWPIVRQRWYRQWRAMLRLNILVGDSLQGVRVVKAFGQEPVEMSRYAEANRDLTRQNVRTEGMWQGIFPLFAFLTGIGGILVWYVGGQQVIRGQVSLGTLIAFTAYIAMLLGPMQWFSQLINWVTNALAAADRVFEIIDAPADVRDAADVVFLPHIRGTVEFDGVTFGYESHRPVVRDLRLAVAAGEMIGLVGHSGAGKSTLINLLCRFYDPDEGVVRIDGVDLRRVSLEDLHRQIGVVLQDTFLFDGTVRDNIAYARPGAGLEDIVRAAKIANAHEFILKMPDAYDTRVGERGQRLSGGEKQRIAIARAVLRDPRILILDEATASLDTDTERQIQEALARLVAGRTTLAIAHRLSTLRHANRLVVLDHGRIVEVGTHEELLAAGGVYHRLVEAQRALSSIRGVE
jgi:ATP-binding cassette subfamily B protein